MLRQVSQGEAGARSRLLERHRGRLRQMVACRFDRRLDTRVDPSDVVQDVLVEADGKRERYLAERPMPVLPWLRQLAFDHLTGVRAGGVIRLNATTVFDDGAQDVMTGSSGQDWYFANIAGDGVRDRITDLSAAEFAVDLNFILS
jgi:hypothetical protein